MHLGRWGGGREEEGQGDDVGDCEAVGDGKYNDVLVMLVMLTVRKDES